MIAWLRQWWREFWCPHDFHFRRPDGSWGPLKCWYCKRDYIYPRDSKGEPGYCLHDRMKLASGDIESEVNR